LSTKQRALRALLCAAIAVGIILPGTAAQAEPTIDEVQAQIDKAYDELEHVIEAYNKASEDLKATQTATADLNQQMAPLETQVNAARANVATIASTAYKNGGGLVNATALLSSGSSIDPVRQFESMDRIAKLRQRDISAYSDTHKKYQEEQRRLQALEADQSKTQADLAAKRATIEAQIKDLEAKERQLEARRQASGQTKPAANTSKPPAATGSGKGVTAVNFARDQVGKKYVYGAEGPNSYDCSGLTKMAWAAAGISLPHNAASQYNQIPHVSRANLAVGDLVFSNNLGHVAIYIGNNQVISASNASKPIEVTKIDANPIVGFGRPG
jgi:cell wall-associated NlpC family hydrolase